MIIAFFGLTPSSGVSSSLVSFGIASVFSKRKRVLMIENTIEKLKATQYLFTRSIQEMTREKSTSYYGDGIHNSIAESILRKTGKNRGFFGSIELIKDYLYYLPQNDSYKNVSPINFYEQSLPFLMQSSSIFDDIYIEVHPGNRNLKEILSVADIVVVCLKQDLNVMNSYYSLYSSLLPKSHFLICSYKQSEKPTISDFIRKFGISPSSISAIPYNVAFGAALNRGELFNFVYDNYCLRGEDDNHLILKLREIADRVGFFKTVQDLRGEEIVNSVF